MSFLRDAGSDEGFRAARPDRAAAAIDAVMSGRARAVLLACLILGLWAITRPYDGVVHDARLYTVQALAGPANDLASDFYFAFGSQDNFTLFSLLYRPLVAALGVDAAHRVAALAGQGVWLIALAVMAATIFPRRFALAACLGVVLLSPAYGGLGIFQYGERFATPRIFCEALVMLALAAAHTRRSWTAWALAVAGLAIHPLMAAPGLGLLFALAAFRRPWLWAALLCGAVAAAALALAGLEPFARLLRRFEGDWLEIVRQRCAFAFFGSWRARDYLDLLAKLSVLALAWRLAEPFERRLLAGLALVLAGGFAATIVGADGLDNVLLVNLQPWRVAWLLTLMANAWTVMAILRLPAGSLGRGTLIAAVSVVAVARLFALPDLVGPALLLAGAIVGAEEIRLRRALVLPAASFVKMLSAVAAGLLAAFFVLLVWTRLDDTGVARLIAGGLLGLAILALARTALATAPTRWAAALGVALVAASVATWDRRDDWARFLSNDHPPADLVAFAQTPGATYWEGGVELNWLLLKRPNYYSCLQGTGAMFYPGTAREYERRRAGLEALATYDFVGGGNRLCAPDAQIPHGPASLGAIREACRALPELRTLILTRALPGAAAEVWRPPVRLTYRVDGEIERVDQFYKYQCADLGSDG